MSSNKESKLIAQFREGKIDANDVASSYYKKHKFSAQDAAELLDYLRAQYNGGDLNTDQLLLANVIHDATDPSSDPKDAHHNAYRNAQVDLLERSDEYVMRLNQLGLNGKYIRAQFLRRLPVITPTRAEVAEKLLSGKKGVTEAIQAATRAKIKTEFERLIEAMPRFKKNVEDTDSSADVLFATIDGLLVGMYPHEYEQVMSSDQWPDDQPHISRDVYIYEWQRYHIANELVAQLRVETPAYPLITEVAQLLNIEPQRVFEAIGKFLTELSD